MSEHHNIQNVIQTLVSRDGSDDELSETHVRLLQHISRHPDQAESLFGYVLAGWRTEHIRGLSLEESLTEARDELQQIRDGGLVGGVYIGEADEDHNGISGESDSSRKVRVACRGSLLEVPLSGEVRSASLRAGQSLVFLDKECRCVTRVSCDPSYSSFGRFGTVSRVLPGRRAYVRSDDGRGEVLTSMSEAIDPEGIKPDETVVRMIDVMENLHIIVEILPDDEADTAFADELGTLPEYARADVIGQDRAWEEIDRLLLRPMRNKTGVDLYNLNGHGGALARSRGLFIAGPSGVGKSMLVAAALHEVEALTGVPVLVKSITGSYFSSKWFGESEHRALSLYRRMSSLARKTGRLPVVVIDEAGPAFMRRSAASIDNGGTQAHNDLTNTFLHIIGTLDVLTIAIDNNPTTIDPAILRPGRLPLVRAERPGFRHCVEIARRNLTKTLVDPHEGAESLATRLCDFIFLAELFQDVIKVKFVGGTQKSYSARDLVTGADLVEGIITPAAEGALKRDEAAGARETADFSGIQWEDLRIACLKRFSTLLRNIDRNDAGEYLDIPEGKVIQSVERKNLTL